MRDINTWESTEFIENSSNEMSSTFFQRSNRNPFRPTEDECLMANSIELFRDIESNGPNRWILRH